MTQRDVDDAMEEERTALPDFMAGTKLSSAVRFAVHVPLPRNAVAVAGEVLLSTEIVVRCS